MEDTATIHPGSEDQINLIGQLIDDKFLAVYGLHAEVVYAALVAMQQDPSLEPYEAFGIGVEEWIK